MSEQTTWVGIKLDVVITYRCFTLLDRFASCLNVLAGLVLLRIDWSSVSADKDGTYHCLDAVALGKATYDSTYQRKGWWMAWMALQVMPQLNARKSGRTY